MFPFFKKQTNTLLDCSAFATDVHAHWLPGIDDGAKDLEHSIALIKALKAAGYKKLIATPHIYWDLYKNIPAIINRAFEQVKQKVDHDDIDIDLHAAAEYMLDEHFNTLLNSEEPLS